MDSWPSWAGLARSHEATESGRTRSLGVGLGWEGSGRGSHPVQTGNPGGPEAQPVCLYLALWPLRASVSHLSHYRVGE